MEKLVFQILLLLKVVLSVDERTMKLYKELPKI